MTIPLQIKQCGFLDMKVCTIHSDLASLARVFHHMMILKMNLSNQMQQMGECFIITINKEIKQLFAMHLPSSS